MNAETMRNAPPPAPAHAPPTISRASRALSAARPKRPIVRLDNMSYPIEEGDRAAGATSARVEVKRQKHRRRYGRIAKSRPSCDTHDRSGRSRAMVYVLGGWQSDFAAVWSRQGIDLADAFAEGVNQGLRATALDAAEIETGHVGNFDAELFAGQGLLGGIFAQADAAFAGMPSNAASA